MESNDNDFCIDICLRSSSPCGKKYFSGKFDSSDKVFSAAVFGSLEIAKYLSGNTLKLLFRLSALVDECVEELLFLRRKASSYEGKGFFIPRLEFRTSPPSCSMKTETERWTVGISVELTDTVLLDSELSCELSSESPATG